MHQKRELVQDVAPYSPTPNPIGYALLYKQASYNTTALVTMVPALRGNPDIEFSLTPAGT